MKAKVFKTLAITAVFGLSYVGFTFSNATERIAGEKVTVTLLSLSTQANAACPDTDPYETPGLGVCNSFGRCAYNYDDPMGWGDCRP